VRLAAALLLLAPLAARAECRDDRLTIRGEFGQAAFTISVADDEAERARGLMFVESMPTLEGMLFVYPRESTAAFWMENTLIPLDMLFADATGTIVTIHPDAVPMDRTPIPGGDNVQYVLEINGGLAERLGIAVGDTFQHPSIGTGAADPCP
jgi:uncharacterized membrane protein (UPF0127 family)